MQEERAGEVEHREGLPVDVDAKLNEILTSLSSLKQELSSLTRSSRAASSTSEEEGLAISPSGPPPPRPAEFSPGSATSFVQQRATSSTVRLNVGGKCVHVSWNLMLQLPTSRLGKIAQCRSAQELLSFCDNYDPDNNEIFFNYRHNNIMGILNFYRSNILHISNDCCPIAFMADLSYWGLPETALEPCCFKRWMECKDQLEWEQPIQDVSQEEFPAGASQFQQRLWDTFEHPHTSTLARVIGSISVACIFISTIILTLETLPYFQENENKIHGEYAPFMIIEAIYMAYFTFEFLIRLISCPSKFDFLKNTMNWIDLLAIVPYFFTLALNSYGLTEEGVEVDLVEVAGLLSGEPSGIKSQLDQIFVHSVKLFFQSSSFHAILIETFEKSSADARIQLGDVSRTAQYFRLLKMARIVKTLRIIRIFKLARHSTGLQALGNTMKANYKELGLLFLLLGMGAIMFASLIFVFEKEDAKTTFKTMFDAYWWAIITMTTVSRNSL